MDYQMQRLIHLLHNYRSLSTAKRNSGDSLAVVAALQAKGEQIRLIEYGSGGLQISTLTVENVLSFTEKCTREDRRDQHLPHLLSTKLGAADQLVHYMQGLIHLIEQFRALSNRIDHKSPTKLIASLQKSNSDLIRMYEAPWSVTIEIYKIASFTTKASDCLKRRMEFRVDAANQAILFLNKLAKMEHTH